MSFLSRFSWALPAIGPSLLYGPLFLVCAWVCVTGGWHVHGWWPGVHSGAAIPCAFGAFFFGLIVVSEWHQAWAARRYHR